MINYEYRLTEEIARWAFEVRVKSNSAWNIVFTNPTAGPWKRLEAVNQAGQRGEVYRFDRDEARPDIVMVNDALKSVLIIEAKDTLAKLLAPSQVKKSCEVVLDMASVLQDIKDSEYWGERWGYRYFNSLLWGAQSTSDEAEIERALRAYEKCLKGNDCGVDAGVMLGIEVSKLKEDIELFFYGLNDSQFEAKIISSL